MSCGWRDSLWLLIGLYSPRAQIGRTLGARSSRRHSIRRGEFLPSDQCANAQAARRINGFADLDGIESPATARVFKSGNSQAVRLPREFRVECRQREILHRGNEIVLREPAEGLKRTRTPNSSSSPTFRGQRGRLG